MSPALEQPVKKNKGNVVNGSIKEIRCNFKCSVNPKEGKKREKKRKNIWDK